MGPASRKQRTTRFLEGPPGRRLARHRLINEAEYVPSQVETPPNQSIRQLRGALN